MKKRLLSLVLCLVMVFSLLPMGSFAIDRVEEKYVSIGTNWTNTTNYGGLAAANNSLDGKVYYKDGDSYKEVNWETGKPLYSLAADKAWSPADVGSSTSYYYNVNSDKLTFSQVSTKSGYIYYPSSVDFRDLTSDDQNLHTDYWYWMTKYFVRNDSVANDITAEGGFSRMQMMNYGSLTSGAKYVAWVYYFKDGSFNNETPQTSHKYTSNRSLGVAGIGAHTGLPDGNTNWWNRSKVTYVSVDGDGNGTPHEYRWWTGEVVLDRATYERKTGLNSLYYNNGATQLGSTVYLASDSNSTASYENVWTGKLYNRNGTGTTKLMDKTTGATLTGCTPSAIKDDVIYTGDLYVFKKAPADPPETEQTIITTETGDDGVYTSKNLTPNGDAYDVTLTAYTTGNEVVTSSQTITPTVKPMDIVMVIDQSGSMATRDMGNTYSAVATPEGGWTVDAATTGKQYYYSPDGGLNYYPVYASTGYIYEKVDSAPRASDMLNSGDDAISLGVNGAPTFYNVTTDYYVMHNGELHRLYLITAGLFLQYGLYPYIYTDNNDGYTNAEKWEGNNYWVAVFDPWDGSDLRDNSIWNGLTSRGAASSRVSFVNTDGQAIGSSDSNADSARLSYSWFTSSDRISNLYKQSDTKVANQLYYIDSAGNRQNIGTTAQYAGDVVYTGTLYEGNSESRVDALKAAVTEFANTVQANAKQFGVDHRMALVGFAGNKVPAYSLGSAATTVGSNGLKDYTNTGLFSNGGFENYEKITGFQSTSEQYINRHYYKNVSGIDGTPVKYSDGWKTLNLTTGATASTSAGNWYEATYEGNGTSLSAADYRAALVSVNNNDQLNTNISTAISQFAANGGTYTSYGMTMAEQLYKAVEDAGDTQGVDSEGQTVERQRVIIVFTDGEPGANGYDSSIAGEALVSGNLAKTEQDAIVYTVGLFKSAPSSQVADFMKKLSSEYEMTLAPVYGGEDNDNNSLGSLNPNKTYYYKNETTGKYYAVTTEYGTDSSLGWWIYNGSHSGTTESYSLTNPRRSTGAGTTVFYNAKGSSVNGEDVKTGTTYYTSNGDKIVYEYRWFDSDRSIKNPALQSGQSTSAGEARVQFYELTGAAANDDGLSYYLTASNTAELNNVFAQIAGSLIEKEVTVTNGSAYTEDTLYVMDEISADFDLPADLSAANNHVTVYAEQPSGWVLDHEETDAETGAVTQIHKPNWDNSTLTLLKQGDEEAIRAGNADVKVTWEGKKLKVEYFDFGRMYMQQSNPDAARIRVVISGITPNHAGEKLYSNTPQSGLYYKDPNPENDTVTLVEAFNRPFISVPGYTVKWVDDQGTNMANPYDQDTDLIKGNFPVYDGGEPTKDSVVIENESRTDYTFDGWSTTPGGAKVIDDITRDAESGVVTSYGTFPAVVDSDVIYYAHFAPTVSNFYTATWFNGTTELYQQPGLANGDVPEYGGAIPAKDADNTYTYFFAGWHKDSRLNDNDVIPANRMPARDDAEYNAKLAALLNELHVSAQPDAISGADVNYYAVFAPVQIQTRNIIVEYSAKYLVKGGSVKDFDAMYTPGGEFTLEKAANEDSGDFFFTANPKGNSQYFTSDAVIDTTGFSKVNTGVYYEGENKTQPTKVNIIPGASVYFDDNLLDAQVMPVDNTAAGNYTGVSSDVIGTADYNAADGSRQLTFTFTGTGVDIYSTTLQTGGGYIVAMLKGNGVSKSMSTKNTAAENRVNVPSIYFRDLPYGTYTITLTILKGVDYQLDGMRVYGALNSGEGEKNATFTNLRELLVDGANMGKNIGFFSDTNATAEQQKTVYVKDLTDEGEIQYEADGKTIKTKAVQYAPFTLEAYTIDGPKNEIYLDKGNAIAFTITNWDDVKNTNPGIRLMAGISSPDSADAEFSINQGESQPASQIDQYYDVTPAENSNEVMIANTSNVKGTLISVTNLKIVGGESELKVTLGDDGAEVLSIQDSAEAQELRIAVTEETLAYAAEFTGKRLLAENEAMIVTPDVPDTPDTPDTPDEPDTPSTPSIFDALRQLISAFTQNLFKSIARLFGN